MAAMPRSRSAPPTILGLARIGHFRENPSLRAPELCPNGDIVRRNILNPQSKVSEVQTTWASARSRTGWIRWRS